MFCPMELRHTPENGETLISIGHAARLLGVHSDTVRRWTASGQIAAVRTPGGHRRYRLADVDRMRGVA